ncbi:hypothetical protein IF650_08085 [Cellulosimicrobium terreum]|nr:hypothetical protein [Cellulosimicrobium terreum]
MAAVVAGAVMVASGALAGAAVATVPADGPRAMSAEVQDVVRVEGLDSPRTVIRSADPRSSAGDEFSGSRTIGACPRGPLCALRGEARAAWDFSAGLEEAGVESRDVLRATLQATVTPAPACTSTSLRAFLVGPVTGSSSWSTHRTTWTGSGATGKSDAACARQGEISWELTDSVRDALAEGRPVALGVALTRAGLVRIGADVSLSVELGAAAPSAVGAGTSDPQSACVVGKDRPAVRSATPMLRADLRGDGSIGARFAVFDLEDGTELWSEETTPRSGGTQATVRVAADVMVDGRAYAWEVRAATPDGGWSAPSSCELVVDLTSPEREPGVTPVEGEPAVYREGVLSGGVGIPGAFVLSSDEADVMIAYSFRSSDALIDTVSPGTRVEFVPTSSGPYTLFVRAVDRSGRSGPLGSYDIRVASASPQRWSFSEGSGLQTQADSSTATLHLSDDALWGDGLWAEFGWDPSDRGLVLPGDGSAAWSETPLVATGGSYTVGVTVRADDAGRTRVAVSQAGERSSAFALGQRKDAACGTASGSCWAFWTWGADASDATPTVALSGMDVHAGHWVRLTAVRDSSGGENRLYVCELGTAAEPLSADVVLAATAPAPAPGWASSGGFQIGRRGVDGSWSSPWAGSIDRLSITEGMLSSTSIFRECSS